MPHSGGGGSHGGGSHGGSHHSGSGGGARSNRVSNTPFAGGKRYFYYYQNRPHYYYAERKVQPNSISGAVFSILFAIIWLAMSSIPLVLMIAEPIVSGPLSLNYDTSIVIDDQIGIIDDEKAITDAFKSIQKETGVTFSIVTRTPENAYFGNTHTDEAYNCYVSRWDDESHWLIYYVGSDTERRGNWYWELMCGDDCSKILGSSQENNFTNNFHKYLVATERYTFSKAVTTAVSKLEPGSENSVTEIVIIYAMMALFPIVGIFILIMGIAQLKKAMSPEEKAKAKAVELSELNYYPEVVCDYCSGVYLQHTCTECPHCGAPVKVDTNTANPM